MYRTLWAPVVVNLAAAAVSGFFAMRLGSRLIAQLRRLQEHAQALSRGEWEHAVEPSGVRELAELSAAFNQMGAAIRQQTAQSEAANEKLAAANEKLEGEIADAQAAQECAEKTAEQLTRSNKELEQFAYIASHDLQEPLRVVTGYVQLIERKYKDRLDAEAGEFMNYIRDGVSRMQQLITDLLSYSRLGTRGKPFGPVNVETVLEHATTNLRPLIDQNGAVVAHQSLPEVRGDETQLLQLFQNLIANAVKFHGNRRRKSTSPPSGRTDDGSSPCTTTASASNGSIWDQIFVIFQRLHTRQKYPGTGIGLAVCKRIVEPTAAASGSIPSPAREPRSTSPFPLNPEDHGNDLPPTDRNPARGRQRAGRAADDGGPASEAKVRNRLSVVEDGVEALDFLRRQGPHAAAARPDLILLDLNLPRKTAARCCTRSRTTIC